MKQRFEEYLGEFVYGAIDGTVTTFAVVAAAVGAGLDSSIIVILGLANLIGDGFSMGAGAYLAAQSKRDLTRKNNPAAAHNETPLGDGLATFIAFVLVGFVPVLAYVLDALLRLHIDSTALFAISTSLTTLTFVSIGLLKARVTKTGRLRASIETLLLGAIAAGLAYGLGDLLEGALTGK